MISGLSLSKNQIHVRSMVGKLTIDDVRISGSTAAYGGALYVGNDGDVEITNSHFEGNTGTRNAGAVYIYNTGKATISGSTFVGNTTSGLGGAIYIGTEAGTAGDLELFDDVFSHNSATGGAGGAAYIGTQGTVTIARTTFDSNSTGAGSWGGALYVNDQPGATTITDSTFSNNTAGSGGAVSINTGSPVLIANSTMTGNAALGGGNRTGYAGALYLSPNAIDVTLAQDTITANTAVVAGAGIFSQASFAVSGTIVSANTILVGQTSLNGPTIASFPDIEGTAGREVVSNHSLIGQISPALTLTDVGGTVRSDTPGLLALADNGGPTRTMALAPTSPAIDAGPNPVAPFPGNAFDQRGSGHPRIVGTSADIGAYESDPTPAPTTTAAPGPVVPTFTG